MRDRHGTATAMVEFISYMTTNATRATTSVDILDPVSAAGGGEVAGKITS